MKNDANNICVSAKILDLNLSEIGHVSAGAAPTQYLSGMANATSGAGGVISSGITRLIGLAKNGCGYLTSAV